MKKAVTEPPCTIIEKNKPNLEIMAKAFLDLYKETKEK
jgi:hypothetical protein